MKRRIWAPRCCLSCGEPLEQWKWPLQPGAYIACPPCARLYVVGDDGLEPVLLADLDPEWAWLARELLEAEVADWWASRVRVTPPAFPTQQAA